MRRYCLRKEENADRREGVVFLWHENGLDGNEAARRHSRWWQKRVTRSAQSRFSNRSQFLETTLEWTDPMHINCQRSSLWWNNGRLSSEKTRSLVTVGQLLFLNDYVSYTVPWPKAATRDYKIQLEGKHLMLGPITTFLEAAAQMEEVKWPDPSPSFQTLRISPPIIDILRFCLMRSRSPSGCVVRYGRRHGLLKLPVIRCWLACKPIGIKPNPWSRLYLDSCWGLLGIKRRCSMQRR